MPEDPGETMKTLVKFLRSRTFLINVFSAFVIMFVVLAFTYKWLHTYTNHGETITVPDIRGLQVQELDEFLQYKSLNYKIADSSVYDVSKAPGTVIEQDPEPNAKVKENRTVYITVTRNIPPKVKMPNLVDVSFKQASAILESFGLQLGETIYQPDLAKNAVLEMQIRGKTLNPGTMVSKGTKIDLLLGDGYGSTKVEVPDLTDLNLSEALFVLKGASLTPGSIVFSGEIKDSSRAIVYKQIPEADGLTTISQGEVVDIFLK